MKAMLICLSLGLGMGSLATGVYDVDQPLSFDNLLYSRDYYLRLIDWNCNVLVIDQAEDYFKPLTQLPKSKSTKTTIGDQLQPAILKDPSDEVVSWLEDIDLDQMYWPGKQGQKIYGINPVIDKLDIPDILAFNSLELRSISVSISPEPGTAAILVIGSIALLRRRNRCR